MATRTRYRRGSSSAYGYGGAWLRSWFGPAAQGPNGENGGAAPGPVERDFRAPPPPPGRTGFPPNSPLAGLIAMGGSVAGASADGKTLIVNSGGRNYYFDATTGQPIATNTGGAGATNNPGAPVAAPMAPTGASAPSSRIGQIVNATLPNGTQITGRITGVDANGQTTVQWQDGTTATYSPTGQLVSSQPPATPNTGGGTTGGGTTTTTQPPPVQQGAPPPPVPDVNAITPPPPAGPPPPPDSFTGAPATGTPTGDTSVISPGDNGAYTAPPPPQTIDFGPPPSSPAGSSPAFDAGAVNPPAPPPPEYAPPPPPPNNNTFDAGLTNQTAPPPAPSPADVSSQLFSTPYGWMSISQLEALMGPATTYTPPPTSPSTTAYEPPPVSTAYFDPGMTDYAPPPPPLDQSLSGPSLAA